MSETNTNIVFDANTSLILEKGEAQDKGIPLFTAHWHIFARSIVIFVAYAVSWFLLSLVGKSDTTLARLFIIVMSGFVPLLAAYAFLRYQTIRLQINENSVSYHPGWPKDLPLEVSFAMIESVEVRRGLSGRLLGGGTIVLNLPADKKIIIADLSKPELAKEMIEAGIFNT